MMGFQKVYKLAQMLVDELVLEKESPRELNLEQGLGWQMGRE